MPENRNRGTILIAEDDEEDLLLIQEALKECRGIGAPRSVKDGEELMDYLCRRGKYREARPPRPALILLDLRMPRKDGHEALQEIRSNPELRPIPVVVLTTSRAEEDIRKSYALGANSYITKPDDFEGLVDALRALEKYWFGIVSLPGAEGL
ncbi:MAG: two-component system response regulator [Candidatus Handelsmanbacteria bacterium RIFCSPLOWO2_12_FULL_64_10]|uniref:Two-component system response regulator n=1 Tax=Handelsmanbacteria sp. (strain RIFCSPLOWO2_12_FULL_64_10) TaxID=1817868 RepID=A0A1F6C2X6_HANXR|nr:MAG: two-component system response regulator [Candidatus Handelsmanbacteria bacterium RIFCSPLOWO2_12_FULL_64_10]